MLSKECVDNEKKNKEKKTLLYGRMDLHCRVGFVGFLCVFLVTKMTLKTQTFWERGKKKKKNRCFFEEKKRKKWEKS